ncbi:hypothetical protein L2E82_44947 [Cichorium intybus]|uniref:Uncharacterized protein n=1 Tax=Cichorium intybus TaxID=13427 RepID=A0ACB8ZS59_CICIN|nr:hypothetical protein L2E82_44947 [Cichorium intybus]
MRAKKRSSVVRNQLVAVQQPTRLRLQQPSWSSPIRYVPSCVFSFINCLVLGSVTWNLTKEVDSGKLNLLAILVYQLTWHFSNWNGYEIVAMTFEQLE